MIKANELRIGNLVSYHDDNTLFEVTKIDELGIGVKNEEQETWIEYDCFSPITLTEEWLLKFGFKKEAEGYYLQTTFYIRVISYPDLQIQFYSRTIHSDFYKIVLENDIKCVHQLQNLYFALTGEELIINKI